MHDLPFSVGLKFLNVSTLFYGALEIPDSIGLAKALSLNEQ